MRRGKMCRHCICITEGELSPLLRSFWHFCQARGSSCRLPAFQDAGLQRCAARSMLRSSPRPTMDAGQRCWTDCREKSRQGKRSLLDDPGAVTLYDPVSGYVIDYDEKTGTAYMTGEVAKRYLQDLTSFSEAFPKLF